ncbi:riboflavin synthase [Candidatus Pantoea edessiphila]|uniref:Riboflavin synthase n=1 Tax=Candidatus Pantoea edessiphila TaxID=2044610 RepID=A0A2P5SYR3_9GAMM|nr:riboflavin synthase subunit alpha [Candidatus Pantoea edessiphila]MBK4775391.1 riboflavin synthase subunit alpha [Pantoea sp. Edef]PPI87479.1 riboflavin synthase [Candidatus Pantoea edessiphila]
MFTGIVQGIAEIVYLEKKKLPYYYTIKFPKELTFNLALGSSIMVNGCCLTVANIDEVFISFSLIRETLRVSNLNSLCEGDLVNIERAAKINHEIGGHLMSGHVMTTAEIYEIDKSDNNYTIWLKIKDINIMKYILYKGFIGIDGISLTVGEIIEKNFCVFLVPETLKRTNIGKKGLGYHANIEIDLNTQGIVHTIERLISLNKRYS